MNADQPVAIRLGDGRERRGAHVVVRQRRNRPFDERHRVVDEDAGRLAARRAFDASAGRILRRRGHAGRAHRGGVGENRVTVDALEHDGIVRRDARQRVVRRKARVSPFVLIPAATDHPPIRRNVFDARGDARDDRLVRARVGDVEVGEERPEPEQVRVRVDHAGDDRLAAGVEHARGRAFQEQRLTFRTDELHSAVAHGHRGDERMRVVDGVDPRVGDDQVGGRWGGSLTARGPTAMPTVAKASFSERI